MQTLTRPESHSYISRPPPQKVSTGVDRLTPMTRSLAPDARAWQTIINERLGLWLRDPGQLADEGVTPPSPAIVELAIGLAQAYRDENFPCADSVVAGPNGEIQFEWRLDGGSEVIDIWDDGLIEHMRFEGTRLVERKPL